MKIKAFITHMTFQNPENGYTVAETRPLQFSELVEELEEELALVGTLPGLAEGMTIEAEGEMGSHPVYGPQFKVSSFHEIRPEGIEAIERYLGSGAIPGIGAKMAKRIVDKFGEDAFG